MLIRFSVENFKSFRDHTEFYMSAGRAIRHGSHVVESNGKRLLKSAFIFGANASGKSNLIKAIYFARDVIMMGLDKVSCDRKYFRIDEQYNTHPGVFQFDFLSNGSFYSYGFAISYDSASIEEEWLYEIGSKETCIFFRQKTEDGQSYDLSSDLNDKGSKRLNIYMDDFKNIKLRQTLFMSDVASRAPDDDDIFQAYRDASEWFSKLVIIFPSSLFGNVLGFVHSKGRKLSNYFNHFDTGINDIFIEKTDAEKLFSTLPSDLLDKIKSNMFGQLEDEGEAINMNLNGDRLEVRNVDGKLTVSKIVLDHGNPNDRFSFSDESDGTQRLFDLLPIYNATKEGYVVLIDEIDRSLHTKLTLEFIDLFYQQTEGINAQLIATTQDSNLMDLDILRQDEIWFVEREKDHSSSLYSLNKFKIRYDKKVGKDYLLGRYGGVPIFNQFSMVEPEDNEEGELNENN